MSADEKLKDAVRKFLQTHRTAAIATTSPETGDPQVANVNYVFDDDFNFFFITRKQSRKFENLERRKRVGILVGNDPKVPACVQIQGTAELVTTPHYMISYFSKQVDLADSGWWALTKTPGVNYVVFKVNIDWLRWLNLDITGYPETYMTDFQQIIP